MEKSKFQATPNHKGKFLTPKKAIGIITFGLVCSAGVLFVVKHKQAKATIQKPSVVREVKYVFFSPDGKPITLSEQDVYDVKQKYEDGVLPSAIAEEYDMNAVMVCRIINCVKAV